MKYLGIIFVAIPLLFGAEKINWALTEKLDWKFENKTVAQPIPKKKSEATKQEPAKTTQIVTPYVVEYQYLPEIIYTQPRTIRYYRATEYLCKPCK